MLLFVSNLLAVVSESDIARFRLVGMFAVLIGGLASGYLASNRFGVSENLAKKLMTFVLVFFNWQIALLVIWQMQLSRQLIWLPVTGLVLMLSATALSILVFSFLKIDQRSRLTLILAGGLSNTGYTGGAFVCYAIFGTVGLALANIYHILSIPTFYFIYLPLLKFREVKNKDSAAKFKFSDLFDLRMLAIPAIIAALILNLTSVKAPFFISQLHIVDVFVYLASFLSFFSIGLRVKFSRLRNYKKLYFMVGAVKFILIPIAALLIIWILALTGHNLTDLVQKVIIVLSVAPCAIVMVTMSNVFDLDGPLASAVWVVTSAGFAVIVVPVLFFVFA